MHERQQRFIGTACIVTACNCIQRASTSDMRNRESVTIHLWCLALFHAFLMMLTVLSGNYDLQHKLSPSVSLYRLITYSCQHKAVRNRMQFIGTVRRAVKN